MQRSIHDVHSLLILRGHCYKPQTVFIGPEVARGRDSPTRAFLKPADLPQVVEVGDKKCEFTPSEIHVKRAREFSYIFARLASVTVFAEKFRACYQRKKARDVYGLGMYATRSLDNTWGDSRL